MGKTDWLPSLREKLLTATEFADVLRFFFDRMDEDPAFLDRGKPVSRRGLEEMLRFTAKQMLDENARISRMLIISIPEHRFYHGPVTVDGNAGNFFFFEDAQMGLMSIVVSKTGETRMARIAAVPQPMKSDD